MAVLLAVLAHPDDESMGTGGLLHRHAAAGVEVHLVCATRGGEGWTGKPIGATKAELPRIRSDELAAAAEVLGLAGVELWDYPDGGVPGCDQAEITSRIVEAVQRRRPLVVVGWGPDGGYGHPDHIAMGACTDAAIAQMGEEQRPALYHMAMDEEQAEGYREAFRLVSGDAGSLPLVAAPGPFPVLELTEREIEVKTRAIDCHASQVEDWRIALKENPALLRRLYGREGYLPVSGGDSSLNSHGLLREFV